MTLPLPNLDDRRWTDLVEEGRNLIPRYAPEWTDFNVHDPGITLLELLAWITEIDIFRLNRIPESHRRKFLALLGIRLQPPQASQTIVEFSLRGWVGSWPEINGIALPATTEVETAAAERPVRFRTLEAVTVVPAQLAALWREEDHALHNVTELWKSHEPLPMFGEIPKVGSVFYFGFSEPLPEGATLTLYLAFSGGKSGLQERRRLQEEWLAARQDCSPPLNLCQPETVSPPVIEPMNLPHHSARTVWEVGLSPGDKTSWRTLDTETAEVVDETRACTLDGFVRVTLPALASPPAAAPRYYYLRCRWVSGEYDAPPILQSAIVNAALAEQAVPAGTEFTIAKNASVSGPVPQAGSFAKFTLRFNTAGEIATLVFLSAESDAPEFFIARLSLPTGYATGSLVSEMQLVDTGLGEPSQEIVLRPAPVQWHSLRIFTLEDDVWNTWSLRPDFDASARNDRHFLLDATAGTVVFGDGENGLPAPRAALIFAEFHTTDAERGNVLEQKITRLSFSAHNQGLLDEISILDSQIAVSNPFPAANGAEAETLEHAEGRALEEVSRVTRAITIADIEYLVRATPGTNVARTAVKANLDARYPCLQAPGTTSVIILPQVAAGIQPSPGLRAAVQRYLDRRRILGNRIEVVGPAYTKVTVRARVQGQAGASSVRVREDILQALRDFFDPLYGGPEKTGWPFGRDVYRSEVLQTIDGVDGVENVVSLELIADDGVPSCGNLCIQPCGLVISGEHVISLE